MGDFLWNGLSVGYSREQGDTGPTGPLLLRSVEIEDPEAWEAHRLAEELPEAVGPHQHVEDCWDEEIYAKAVEHYGEDPR